MSGLLLGEDEPVAVVGDVHGRPDRLQLALADLTLLGRRIIFVGDYVNRGPDSKTVLEILAACKEALGDSLVLLRGNHEVALLRTLSTGDARDLLRHRGASTIKSYVGDVSADVLERFIRDYPKDHLRLLESMPLYAENSTLLISHAGYNPARPSSRTQEDLTTGHWPTLLTDSSGRTPRPSVVFGHYPQYSGVPLEFGAAIAIDTGCGTIASNPLTAVLLPERSFRQY
ncbi:metallophosphoesterase [Blastococcus sp. SYSU DS1021]